MRSILSTFVLLLSFPSFAQNWNIYLNSDVENGKKVIENLDAKLESFLPPSWNQLQTTKIKFVSFKNPKIQARYNKVTKQISVSKSLLDDEDKLLRTVIHELSHAYEDQINKISHDFSFQQLAGWHKRGLMRPLKKRKNFAEDRSPDHYEFKSSAEAFAVNMEYYLTDVTYACRRPSLYQYLSSALSFTPKHTIDCESTNLFPIYTNGMLEIKELDPTRLYAIHYLLADKGSAVESRLGHSMLRLVFCSPARKVMNDDCVKDVDHQIVLSYRANVQDLSTNYIKGLIGKYNSQAFFYTMFSVIDEYTRVESRNLLSYPINLSQEQKDKVFDRIKEELWSYRGKYRFLSQNCATETSDFIKTLVASKEASKIHVRTPMDVYRKYHKIGVIADIPVADDSKVKAGYYFESKKARFEKYYQKIAPFNSQILFEEFIDKSKPQERLKLYDQMKQQEKSASLIASLLILEKHIQMVKKMQLGKASMTKLMKEIPNLTISYKDMLNNYLEGRLKVKSDHAGYGIPLTDEVIESAILPPSLIQVLDQFKEWIETHYDQELKEIDEIQYNLEVFSDFITTPL